MESILFLKITCNGWQNGKLEQAVVSLTQAKVWRKYPFFKNQVELIYNVVLVSAVQQNHSVFIHI